MDRVSVIVPVYNVERYLEKCINSILVQSYINLEIILVNDGSTDNCGMICDAYKEKDSRIKVIHKKNGGLSSARNAGMRIATGEYIAFVDSDDYIHPDMYMILMKELKSKQTDIAICGIEYVDDCGRKIGDNYPLEKSLLDKKTVLRKLQSEYQVNYVVVWNKLYKKSVWEKVVFPEGKQNEDVAVMHLIYWNADKVAVIEDKLYCYVQREDSIMHTLTIHSLDVVEFLINKIEFYEKNGLESYIEDTCFVVLDAYFRFRFDIPICTNADRDYVRRIDSLFLKTGRKYYKYSKTRNIKNTIKFWFPWMVALKRKIQEIVDLLL